MVETKKIPVVKKQFLRVPIDKSGTETPTINIAILPKHIFLPGTENLYFTKENNLNMFSETKTAIREFQNTV